MKTHEIYIPKPFDLDLAPSDQSVKEYISPEHIELPITSRWKKGVVWGNALLGLAGVVVGNTETLSVAIDGGHNTADAGTYNMQANDVLHPEQSLDVLQRRRKLAHWVIALGALGGSVKAGWDMYTGQEYASDVWDMGVAAGSVALNGLMFQRLWRGMGNKFRYASVSVRDLVKHFALVDMPSAALALFGSAVQNTSSKLEQAAAVASGVVAAVAFRPTKHNLAHNCLGHTHIDDEMCGHVHSHEGDLIERIRVGFMRTVEELSQ